MPTILMKGAEVVKAMKAGLVGRSAALAAAATPKLAIVRVGDRPDDKAYERNAVKRCKDVGIECEVTIFGGGVTHDDFMDGFRRVNADGSVHGILVFSPLPASIDINAVKAEIDPDKDVDCMGFANMAKLYAGDASGHAPCTPSAVMEILDYYGVQLAGKRVTLVGRSLVVGKPLAMLLLAAHATLTVCHTRTKDLAGECRRADVLIAAAGKAGVIGGDCINSGAYVVDVGINVGAGGEICGDVDTEAAIAAGACGLTPVPGGVGAVTTAILARNVIDACERITHIYS